MEKQTFHFLINSDNDEPFNSLPVTKNMDKKLRAFVHCSIIYISAMVQKNQQPVTEITVDIQEEKTKTGKWKVIHLRYHIKAEITEDIAWKACHDSIEKYCPLAETIRKTGARISWDISVDL